MGTGISAEVEEADNNSALNTALARTEEELSLFQQMGPIVLKNELPN